MFKKVAKNALFLSSSQVFSRLIGLAYFMLLARFLTVEKFGVYAFTLSFVYNFIPVADFGIERLVLRDISREPEKTSFYLARLLPLRIVLATAAYSLILLSGLILGQPMSQIIYLAIFGLALFPYNLTFLLSSFLNAKEKMKYTAMVNLVLICLTVLFGIIFVYFKLGLEIILFSYPLANLILAIILLGIGRKLGMSLGWNIDWEFWKTCLKESWVFATLTIIAVFYLRISIVAVNLLKGSVATGLYGTSFKFIEGLILIPQSLSLALFPVCARLSKVDLPKLRKVYFRGVLILFLLSLPIALSFSFFAKIIITVPYGAKYLSASPTLPVLGLAAILFFVNALAGNIIQNSEKVKMFISLFFLNFVFEIILCLSLIPRWGIVGAAWSVVGGEVFALVINNLLVFNILRPAKQC